MREKLTVIKVGGKIVEEEATLRQLLNDFAAIDGHKAVSYTHLDVYKRQLEKRAPFYHQAQYIFNADELEDRWQIETSVQCLRQLLGL